MFKLRENPSLVKFGTLRVGVGFRYKENLYVRIDHKGGDKLALSSDWQITGFNYDLYVEVVELDIQTWHKES